jgi:hypothetical protein
MNKKDALKIVNPMMAIFMLNQALNGLLSDLMPYDLFHLLHKGGWILTPLSIAHVVLNWSCIKSNFARSNRA